MIKIDILAKKHTIFWIVINKSIIFLIVHQDIRKIIKYFYPMLQYHTTDQ